MNMLNTKIDKHNNPKNVKNTTEAANIVAAGAKRSKKLEAPVKIRLARNGGVIEIKFSSHEDLSRLFDSLMQIQPVASLM